MSFREGEEEILKSRIVILGESGTGKSSIIKRYVDGKFEPYIQCTVAGGVVDKVESIEGEQIKLCIWDTAGQERFRSVIPYYLRTATIVILVIAYNDVESLSSIESWKQLIKDKTSNVPIYLVCNKEDIPKDAQQFSDEDLEAAAHGHELVGPFIVSAKSGKGIDDLFFTCAMESLKLLSDGLPGKQKSKETINSEIDLNSSDKGQAQSSCC